MTQLTWCTTTSAAPGPFLGSPEEASWLIQVSISSRQPGSAWTCRREPSLGRFDTLPASP